MKLNNVTFCEIFNNSSPCYIWFFNTANREYYIMGTTYIHTYIHTYIYIYIDTYHYIDSSFILGVNQLIVKEFTYSSKGIFCSIHPRDVRSNAHNVHSSVTPSAAWQLKCRLCPHEGI